MRHTALVAAVAIALTVVAPALSKDSSRPSAESDAMLVYSTYVGSGGARAVAVDAQGSAYVLGSAVPDPAGTSIGTSVPGRAWIQISKFEPDGSALAYSTFVKLFFASFDAGSSLAVDRQGNPIVGGTSNQGCASENSPMVFKLNAGGDALGYSVCLHGEHPDSGYAVAVDAAGNAYLTGLGRLDGFQNECPNECAFVAKFDPAGTRLWVVELNPGVLSYSAGQAIAVDVGGNAYIAGYGEVPTTANAFRKTPVPSSANSGDVFVTKLDPDGTIVYSTYLGVSATLDVRNIAVDQEGNAYVTGQTFSADFPTLNPIPDASHPGSGDVFVMKLNAEGSALVYSTLLGGSGVEAAPHIAVDSFGSAYITGSTTSADFPVAKAIQPSHTACANSASSCYDVFVSKLSPSGSSLVYSTYLGGSGNDTASGIALDASGAAYISGNTNSSDFPTTANAYISSNPGGTASGFLAKIVEFLSPQSGMPLRGTPKP